MARLRGLRLRDRGHPRAGLERHAERGASGSAIAHDQIEEIARGLRRGGAVVPLLRHQAARERFEQRIDLEVRHALVDRRRVEQEVRARDLGAGAVEWQLAAQHLVDDDAEREQIDPVIDRIGDRLFRRHVVGRAEHEAVRGQPTRSVRRIAALAEDRDAEIDDARHLRAVHVGLDDHVLGLEVAVDQPLLVRVIQAFEELAGEVDDALGRHRRLVEDRGEISALREVHDHVAEPIGRLSDVDHADHVRVAEATGELGLTLEALSDLVVLEQVAVKYFDRKRSTDLHVLGAEDRAHRPFAEAHLDEIAVREGLSDQRIRFELFGDLDGHQKLPKYVTAPPPVSGVGVTTRCESFADVTNSTVVAIAQPMPIA